MNDKNKADQGKAPISLVPTRIIWEIAKVRGYGVYEKYPETGRNGWRDISIERIRDAMLRHCLRYIEDPQGVDEESGLPHLSHLATNVAFLCELELTTEENNKSISADDLIINDEAMFKRLSELEEAYTAGHITMVNYVNEYNKMVDEKREKEKQHEKENDFNYDTSYITSNPNNSTGKES